MRSIKQSTNLVGNVLKRRGFSSISKSYQDSEEYRSYREIISGKASGISSANVNNISSSIYAVEILSKKTISPELEKTLINCLDNRGDVVRVLMSSKVSEKTSLKLINGNFPVRKELGLYLGKGNENLAIKSEDVIHIFDNNRFLTLAEQFALINKVDNSFDATYLLTKHQLTIETIKELSNRLDLQGFLKVIKQGLFEQSLNVDFLLAAKNCLKSHINSINDYKGVEALASFVLEMRHKGLNTHELNHILQNIENGKFDEGKTSLTEMTGSQPDFPYDKYRSIIDSIKCEDFDTSLELLHLLKQNGLFCGDLGLNIFGEKLLDSLENENPIVRSI